MASAISSGVGSLGFRSPPYGSSGSGLIDGYCISVSLPVNEFRSKNFHTERGDNVNRHSPRADFANCDFGDGFTAAEQFHAVAYFAG